MKPFELNEKSDTKLRIKKKAYQTMLKVKNIQKTSFDSEYV